MFKHLLGLALLVCTFSANAGSTCHGHFANPITDVCWSCLFPITIGSIPVVEGLNPDTINPASPVCACPIYPAGYRIGITVGFWEPISLVDVSHHPYCLVNMGGIQMDMGAAVQTGAQSAHLGEDSSSFYHVHWYKFPLMYWLNILTSTACMQFGEFDIAYMTELDPTWQSDELAFILNPEAVLFANPIAQASCAADAIAASSPVGALSALFWCAGAQGSMYPLTGHVQEHVGGVQASTLLTERMAYKMHRELLLWDSVGVDSLVCHEYPTPIMPKARYRYQMTNPLPTVVEPFGCKSFGASTALWEAGHEIPVKGEDYGYLVWRKRNCCAF